MIKIDRENSEIIYIKNKYIFQSLFKNFNISNDNK